MILEVYEETKKWLKMFSEPELEPIIGIDDAVIGKTVLNHSRIVVSHIYPV